MKVETKGEKKERTTIDRYEKLAHANVNCYLFNEPY